MEITIVQGDVANLRNLLTKLQSDKCFDEAVTIEIKEDSTAVATYAESNDLYSGGKTFKLAAKSDRFGVVFGWKDEDGEFRGSFKTSVAALKWGISNV